jgi:predicted nucleic acid-binding Zn finger protein
MYTKSQLQNKVHLNVTKLTNHEGKRQKQLILSYSYVICQFYIFLLNLNLKIDLCVHVLPHANYTCVTLIFFFKTSK